MIDKKYREYQTKGDHIFGALKNVSKIGESS